MKAQIQKTFVTTPDDIERRWFVVDAQGQTLGRLASKIAPLLKGKHKPSYVNNLDCGDYVVVINCEKIHVTGNRMDDKFYYRYSGYPSGLSQVSLREMLDKHPDRAIKFAVKGMLPKGPLGRKMLKKLKVYAGGEHPHEAQKPEVLEV
ncbi:MAG: 50S ribosomal protein L13 [Anaerolineae bacterium]|nr:50S ribosomal protein L13 [Anaerolineae bacterium]MCA9887190.1 50S ribosomal protein L13 [Anaerolineae bacterium]MCA9891482.1 50S ribosomal protein L13 [Anaerolineae bacterium]